MDYQMDEYLMISGIQHFEFCPRQWALIHIEQEWAENVKTIQGNEVHKKADQPFLKEKRKELIISRAMPVHSHELKITGICDVVEFIHDEEGISLSQYSGKYRVQPVEYKRGSPKKHDADILQLVAQVMCLEEMLVCDIPEAYLYYNEVKRRIKVEITPELRKLLKSKVTRMQELYKRRHTPKVKTGNWCKNCSLADICLPKLMNVESAKSYIERRLSE
ncbi:CRISPR-associated protein Cas4 [Enterococcus sp. LJL98]